MPAAANRRKVAVSAPASRNTLPTPHTRLDRAIGNKNVAQVLVFHKVVALTPLERSSEEGVQCVSVRVGSEVTGFGEYRVARGRAEAFGHRERRLTEVWLGREKGLCHALVFVSSLEHVAYRRRPPGRTVGPGRAEHLGLQSRQALEVTGLSAPADLGVAAEGSQAGTRRVDQDRVEGSTERRPDREVVGHQGCRGAAAGEGLREERESAGPQVAGDEQAVRCQAGRQGNRLAARGGAGIEQTFSRDGSNERRDELRGLILHQDVPAFPQVGEQRIAMLHHETLRGEQGGPDGNAAVMQRQGGGLDGGAKDVDEHRHGRRLVVEGRPGQSVRIPVPAEPPFDQPGRMRLGDAEEPERVLLQGAGPLPEREVRHGGDGVAGGRRGERERRPGSKDGAQHGVRQARSGALSRGAREIRPHR